MSLLMSGLFTKHILKPMLDQRSLREKNQQQTTDETRQTVKTISKTLKEQKDVQQVTILRLKPGVNKT